VALSKEAMGARLVSAAVASAGGGGGGGSGGGSGGGAAGAGKESRIFGEYEPQQLVLAAEGAPR
jgi:hypothetical protein